MVSHSLCLSLSFFLSVILSINALATLWGDSSGTQSNGLTPLYATGRSLKSGNMTALYLTSDSSHPNAQKSPWNLEITLWRKQHWITEEKREKDTFVFLQNESRWQGSSVPGQMPELWADRGIHDAPSYRSGNAPTSVSPGSPARAVLVPHWGSRPHCRNRETHLDWQVKKWSTRPKPSETSSSLS